MALAISFFKTLCFNFLKQKNNNIVKVKAMAPEFYDSLPYYDSWVKVIIGYIFHRPMNGFCRVKRM